jgi:excisionase family DNA binding protein
MATRSPTNDILMIKEVAEYFKVTERPFYWLATVKKIPGFKVGGGRRFSTADFGRWIKREPSAEMSRSLLNPERRRLLDRHAGRLREIAVKYFFCIKA